MKQLTLTFCLMVLCMSYIYGQDRTLNCNDKNSAQVMARDIKTDVIRNSGYVKKADNNQLSEEQKKNFQSRYETLRTNFNNLYDKMKGDAKKKLSSKKKICNRYGAQLEDLVKLAQEYNKEVASALKLQNLGVGIDDLLALIQQILKLRDEKLDTMYDELKWPEWKDIPERSFS